MHTLRANSISPNANTGTGFLRLVACSSLAFYSHLFLVLCSLLTPASPVLVGFPFHKVIKDALKRLFRKTKAYKINTIAYVLCYCAFPNAADFSHLEPLISFPQSELKMLNGFENSCHFLGYAFESVKL